MLAKFSGLNPKGPYLRFGKKIHFCVVLTDSINRAREIRKFHVAVRQQRLQNVQKGVMHVQSCSFANLNLLLFAVRRRRCKKLPIVVIHKFCYHGNVTSHLSSLLRAVEKLKHLRLCLGEEPGGPVHPLIFRPNWGPNGRKKFFWEMAPPLISGSGWSPPPSPPPPPLSEGLDPLLLFTLSR